MLPNFVSMTNRSWAFLIITEVIGWTLGFNATYNYLCCVLGKVGLGATGTWTPVPAARGLDCTTANQPPTNHDSRHALTPPTTYCSSRTQRSATCLKSVPFATVANAQSHHRRTTAPTVASVCTRWTTTASSPAPALVPATSATSSSSSSGSCSLSPTASSWPPGMIHYCLSLPPLHDDHGLSTEPVERTPRRIYIAVVHGKTDWLGFQVAPLPHPKLPHFFLGATVRPSPLLARLCSCLIITYNTISLTHMHCCELCVWVGGFCRCVCPCTTERHQHLELDGDRDWTGEALPSSK